jgi:hypothetical protein
LLFITFDRICHPLQTTISIILLISPYIKLIVWVVFVASGIGLLLLYRAPLGAQRQSALPDKSIVKLTGVVKDYGPNPNGDIDKIVLSVAGTETLIHFPPHAARQIMQIAPVGTTASVWAGTGPVPGPPLAPPPAPIAQYRLEQIQVGNAVLSIKNIQLALPAAGKPVELEGMVDSLITGGRGEVTGLIINGYGVMLPPHLAVSIAPLLQQGKPVSIKGYERSISDGFVNISKYPLVKPYRMTIDSTDYLL